MTRRHMTILAFALALGAGPALAQNGNDAAQTSAKSQRSGASRGEPDGAVRALGSVDSEHGKGIVTVPDLRTGGEGKVGGPPRDTVR